MIAVPANCTHAKIRSALKWGKRTSLNCYGQERLHSQCGYFAYEAFESSYINYNLPEGARILQALTDGRFQDSSRKSTNRWLMLMRKSILKYLYAHGEPEMIGNGLKPMKRLYWIFLAFLQLLPLKSLTCSLAVGTYLSSKVVACELRE